MNKFEQSVDILARMYKCRKDMKKILGDEYEKKVLPYIGSLKEVMISDNVNEIDAVIVFVEKVPEIRGNSMGIAMLMSAALEITESPAILNETKRRPT